jgi:hypothetical protein
MRSTSCLAVYVLVGSLLAILLGCGLGQKTTTLSLATTPTSIQAGTQMVFTALISHNNGQFLGATWTLTSNGSRCDSSCGTLSNSQNSGSQGNGDTATITYSAPMVPPAKAVTITATSVENTSSSQSDTFSVTAVAQPLAITPMTFPPISVNKAYGPVALQATGGVPPYVMWSIIGGGLPPGGTMDQNGNLSGTPTATGTFLFTVQVQDSVGAAAMANFTITVQ